jgi:hypothetical protein
VVGIVEWVLGRLVVLDSGEVDTAPLEENERRTGELMIRQVERGCSLKERLSEKQTCWWWLTVHQHM